MKPSFQICSHSNRINVTVEANNLLLTNGTLRSLSNLSEGLSILIKGKNELEPTYTEFTLNSVKGLSLTTKIKCFVSQKLIDYFYDGKTRITVTADAELIDTGSNTFVLSVEIGLLSLTKGNEAAKEQLNSALTKVKSLEAQLTVAQKLNKPEHSRNASLDSTLAKSLQEKLLAVNHDLDLQRKKADYYENESINLKTELETLVEKLKSLQQSKDASISNDDVIKELESQIDELNEQLNADSNVKSNSITASTIIFFHIYKMMKKDGWPIRKTNSIFESWRSELKNLKMVKYNHPIAWKVCREDGERSKIGLLKALFMCHDSTDQESILEQSEHDCSIMIECPLNHVLSDDVVTLDYPPDMDKYLLKIFSQDINETYFKTKSTKIGISLMKLLYPLNEMAEYELMMNAITCCSQDYPNLEHLSRVEPSPRSSRTGSSLKK